MAHGKNAERRGHAGKEYWRSRLHRYGECPCRETKRLTHRKERRDAAIALLDEWLADESGLALLGHPTFSGAFFGKRHGVGPEILLGEMYRIAGCDGVIYVNAGGRFRWSQETCDRVTDRLRRPLGPILPSFPIPAGGVNVRSVPACLDRYGPDTMILIGGSLYQQGDLRRATADLVDTAAKYSR